jgi:hypothetical protein
MGEHKLPRAEPAEKFVITPNGLPINVRDLSDFDLAAHVLQSKQMYDQLRSQALQLLSQAQATGQMSAVLEYEQDRRRKSITLATPLDLANLRRQ